MKILQLITYWAAILTIILVTRDNIIKSQDLSCVITNITISILLIFFIIFSIIREFLIARKEKYANINQYRHRCLHILRDLHTYLTENLSNFSMNDRKHMIQNSINALSYCLSNFANIFRVLTGTNCRASIKTLYRHSGRIYVTTLVRDEISNEINYEEDRKRYEEHRDPIEENTDFLFLYEDYGPGRQCFFCNDLTTLRNYKNASFKIYGNPPDSIGLMDRIFKRNKWPLPYKSTIVWPIQQRRSNKLPISKNECIGFLTIDSESRNVFIKRWDFDIGAEIADALYPVIKLYSQLEGKK